MTLLRLLSPLVGSPILPETLPEDPVPLLRRWLEEALAQKREPDPNACVLATVDGRGRPSSRVVLCKAIEAPEGTLVFYTNRQSRKGRDLEANPHAAITFHWAFAGRQARLEGVVRHCTDEESDAYFATRPLLSRIGAWSSDQGQPIDSRSRLVERVADVAERYHVPTTALMTGQEGPPIPRPPHWGGFRLWPERIELWAAGTWRIHERAEWCRDLDDAGPSPRPGPWRATRLQP